MKIPIKVLIADDHVIVRNGLVSILEKDEAIDVIGEGANGLEIIRLIQNGIVPDIVITDINMPEMDGIELTLLIKSNYPEIKVLILTTIDQERNIIESFNAGAEGYLLKSVSIAEVVFAIEQLKLGYKHICTNISIKLIESIKGQFSFHSQNPKLNIQISKREIEILTLIAEGYTNGEIAEKLFTSKRTIEGNRQNLLDKTGKKNTAALINFVVRNGLIN